MCWPSIGLSINSPSTSLVTRVWSNYGFSGVLNRRRSPKYSTFHFEQLNGTGNSPRDGSSMKSPDSDDLEQLFHAAVDLPTADRADFLRRVDPERAKAVLLMIEGAMDPDWNASALEIEARQTALDFRPARPGETFGPYRIVRRIATGGMSIVYEAIRDDAEFQKRVAIKFVQGIQDASSFERFR